MIRTGGAIGGIVGGNAGAPPVTEKNLRRVPPLHPATPGNHSRTGKTKQVEFVPRGRREVGRSFYIYDGAKIDTSRYQAGIRT